MLESILSAFNLNDEEIKTYLLLLETGPTPVGNLAKKMGVPRPSLYGFLKKLQEKGFVTESQKGGVKIFIAESPQKINLFFTRQIENLQVKQKLYKNILPELEKKMQTRLMNPRFQFFEGESGVKQELQDLLLYSDIPTYTVWPIKSMLDIISPEFLSYHNKERIKNNVSIRALWPPSQAVDVKEFPFLGVGKDFLREIRITPKEIDYSMGYWIYQNKVAFVSSRKESFGFIIESKELTQVLLSQFNVIWQISKPLVVNPEYTAKFVSDIYR